MKIVWNEEKNKVNLKSHKISFEEASELFASQIDYLQVYDEQHSTYEDRFISIGPISRGIILVVTAEPEDNLLRIISARFATKNEKGLFEQYIMEL